MQLTIKYFGLIAEITKCNEEQFEFSGILINELIQAVYLKYPKLKEKDFQVAQNNEIVSKDMRITQTEIALLPPFAGG